jgi:Domain of unknown function (DUF6438)/Ankyrin repeat
MICRAAFACFALVVSPLLLGEVPPAVASGSTPVEIDDRAEIEEHRIGPTPVVVTPWRDATTDPRFGGWVFDLTVDERGVVVWATPKYGIKNLREEAIRAARATLFKPFVRDGRPVAARLELGISSRAADYSGPPDRNFPDDPDPSSVLIALKRTSCYGTCPSYRIELRGDGEVSYVGEGNVLVTGSHRWLIDPATIAPLLELFRRANYFALDGYYEYPVSDLPTYITRLRIGERDKFVLNYGGGGFGGAVASTSVPGDWPDMPPVVSEIERAIDKISGVATYVRGDDTTMQRLREKHWDFRSRDAGDAVRMLLSDCNTALARDFIRAGAPVNEYGEGFGGGMPIGFAAHCADVELVRLMLEKGALQNRSDAKSFLWSTIHGGDPRMVTLALKHYGDGNSKDGEGTPLLSEAAGSYVNEDDDPNAAVFDSVKVMELLINAGANPNARDADGKTPIFEANDAPDVTALVRWGADPNARDNEGKTALFDPYFDETKPALLAAGADVSVRDKSGRTALFYQERESSIMVLLGAGTDIEAADSSGQTAIEQMQSEEAILALLAAGAKLPADPARLNAMIAHATERKWAEVLPRLQAAASTP